MKAQKKCLINVSLGRSVKNLFLKIGISDQKERCSSDKVRNISLSGGGQRNK